MMMSPRWIQAFVATVMVVAAVPARGESPAPTAYVGDPAGAVTEDDWYTLRFAERVRQELGLLGFVGLELAAPKALDIRLTIEPKKVRRGRDQIKVVARVKHGAATATIEVEGRAESLDGLASKVAVQAAAAAGRRVWAYEETLLPVWTYPFSVHRFLGRAEVRLRSGDFRQAALMFGRAHEIVDGIWVPEAFAGRRAAEGALVARDQLEPNAKRDLASSAAERAVVALKNDRADVALPALTSFVRYASDRALRWSRPVAFFEGVVLFKKSPWVVQPGSETRWSLDPRSGSILSVARGRAHLVGTVQEDLLTLQGRTLSRIQPDGRARWTLKLPTEEGPAGTVLTSGLFGVLGAQTVAWAEVSFGELGQVARHVTPLTSGVGGVVALVGAPDAGLAPDVALLRPGKRNPSWRAQVPGVRSSRMTRDRLVLVADEGLVLLRSHDGKRVRAPLPLEAGARILGARGRYAAVGQTDGAVVLFDVLAGERTATVRGPGAPVAAQTSGEGMAVLFDTGDVLFLDRDGKMLDRAYIPGRARGLLEGSPVTPGPVAWTSLGLYALAEVDVKPGLHRDVDAEIRAAGALLAAGRDAPALRIATELAMRSAGRVAEAEALRAKILGARSGPGAEAGRRAALQRCRRAESPTQPMGPFVLAAPPTP